MYFDHKQNSDIFLHSPSIYLYFYFMKLLSSPLWYITMLQLSDDSSTLAATAVESPGKDMASGERWWTLSTDCRMTETYTRCLFRWLKVRLISRHPKWSLCLFFFSGLPKYIPWSWKFTAQTSKGGQSVPWRLRFPHQIDTAACGFSWAGEGGLYLM